jgi:hypothetical protein
LRQKGINAVGTIRNNRLRELKDLLESDKLLKKRGRGSYDWRCDHANGITVVKWQDKSAITVASNFISHELGIPTQRYVASNRQYEDIPRPLVVDVYNKVMNGVDVCDQIMSYYRVGLKSRKWYKYVFYYMITAACANAWLLHRRDCTLHREEGMSLADFTFRVGEALLQAHKPTPASAKKRGRPSQQSSSSIDELLPPVKRRYQETNEETRYDLLDHFPQMSEKQERCHLCASMRQRSATFVKCLKCNQFLCFTRQKNCFYKFHHK